MTTKLLTGLASACLLATSLGGCGTLGLPGANAANSAGTMDSLAKALNAINTACTGQVSANLIIAPPLPPSGSFNLNQSCGLKQPGAVDPAPTAAQVSAMVDAAVAKAAASKP